MVTMTQELKPKSFSDFEPYKKLYYNQKQIDFLFDKKQIIKENKIFQKHLSHLPKHQLGEAFRKQFGIKPTDKFKKQKTKVFVGGRGSGKTFTIGKHVGFCFRNLPRATFGLASLTYGQLLNNCLPEIKFSLAQEGLVEGVHYVSCKAPPPHFARPFRPVSDFKNIITFVNGFTFMLMSMDAGDIYRGLSLDGLIVDEMAWVKPDWINQVLIPAIRANRRKQIALNPLHHSITGFTSAPWTMIGRFVYEYEQLAIEDPENVFFIESSAYDNLLILGEDWIERQKKLLPDLKFRREILNERPAALENGFYPTFDETRHVDANVYGYNYNENSGLYVEGWTDYNATDEIHISCDFNAAFMSMICAQKKPGEIRFIKEFFSKNEEIDKLLNQFFEYYKDHNEDARHVKIFGDKEGHKIDEVTGLSLYDRIVQKFNSNGWSCEVLAPRGNIDHKLKYWVLGEAHKLHTEGRIKIRINQHTCPNLILSIINSPLKPDFTKDKSSERQNIPQERATHFSDCYDYILYVIFANIIAGIQTPINHVGF